MAYFEEETHLVTTTRSIDLWFRSKHLPVELVITKRLEFIYKDTELPLC